MSSEQHRRAAPTSVRCFVLTISDTRTEATDTSGDAIAGLLTTRGTRSAAAIVKDDPTRCARGQTGWAPTPRRSSRPAAPASPRATAPTRPVSQLLDKRPRRLRRAVPDAQLPGDRRGGDADPRLRRARSARPRSSPCPDPNTPSALAMTKLILPEIGHVVRELSDDGCPRCGRSAKRFPLDEALAALSTRRRPIERTERVPLATRPDACSRATRRGARRAAVRPRRDGRLRGHRGGHVRRRPLRPKVLRCVENVYTGQVPTRAVGRARRVHRDRDRRADAGRGADAVVMVEETEKGADGRDRDLHAGLSAAARRPARGRHRRRAAVARPGDVLNPSRIGALAAVGVLDVDVYARPRIAILSTGNEIVEPGQPLAPGQIYDINRFTLSAIIAAHGGVARSCPTRQTPRRRSSTPSALRRKTSSSSSRAAARSASAT